jgi:hypothetical protein
MLQVGATGIEEEEDEEEVIRRVKLGTNYWPEWSVL